MNAKDLPPLLTILLPIPWFCPMPCNPVWLTGETRCRQCYRIRFAWHRRQFHGCGINLESGRQWYLIPEVSRCRPILYLAAMRQFPVKSAMLLYVMYQSYFSHKKSQAQSPTFEILPVNKLWFWNFLFRWRQEIRVCNNLLSCFALQF